MSKKKKINLGKTKIEGDFVGGDKITQIIQLPPFVPPPKLEDLKAEYLAYLRRAYRALDFKGIPQFEAISSELLLEEVYVPLLARPERPGGETWERRLAGRLLKDEEIPDEVVASLDKGAAHPVRVEDALGEESRVVVLGDPGSGKSTLLKYLTLRLAAEEDAPLPILLPLNAYARALNKNGDGSLQDYLADYFDNQGVKNLAPLFEAALSQGQAVILLDGLDEVQEGRAYLVNKVENFAAEAVEKGNKLVVSSRIVGYQDAPLKSEWQLYTLLDFTRDSIEDFAKRWCWAFERSIIGDTPEAKAAAEKERLALLESIDANPGVGRLASNPLLLTILALIKRQGVSLPNRRAELYELYLETLIRSWNKVRALDQYPVGTELNPNEVLMTLGPLALWLREENPTAGVVTEDALLGELTRTYMGEDWGLKRGPAREKARAFLVSVRQYSNLLVERGPRLYGFLHLTFEEILAAYGIYQLGQLDLNESLKIIEAHLSDPGWHETILLAVGVWGLANRQPRVAAKVVRAMLKMTCNGAAQTQNILLAGNCLEDVGEEGLGRVAANEVIDALKEIARDRSLLPLTQRDAGLSLGRLAASNPDFLARIRPDLDEFTPIPAGEFLYGDKKKPATITEPFALAKYPVTNLQYRRFIESGGYDKQEFWSAEGWSWRTGEYDTKATGSTIDYLKRRSVEKRHEPYFWHDAKWNNPLAPVVGVSWFEAEAYANWLSEVSGRPMRLPTEQEWEYAARGANGREYPWGDKFDFNHANGAEFWAQDNDLDWNKWFDEKGYENASTTFVGQFDGATPEGIIDLSGNVFEWTNSWYEDEQVNRTSRGGSWLLNRRNLRAASRIRNVPVNFLNKLGFRLLSPSSVSGF